MKTEADAEAIRRAYLEAGTIAGAARACGCTWRTARAALARDYTANGGRTRRRVKPSPWRARIGELLDANADDERASRKLRLTAARIGEILAGEGCSLNPRHVRRIVAEVRAERAERRQDAPRLRLRALPGDFQADFGEYVCGMEGRRRRVHVLILASRYSGAFEAVAVRTERQEHLFVGLLELFRRFGGVPPRIRFDNAPGIVAFRDGRRRMADAFGRFAVHCGFSPELCRPRAGWEKGAVEERVGYLRSRFFVPVPAFGTFGELNAALAAFCERDRARPRLPVGPTISEALAWERIAFLALPPPFPFERPIYTRADRQGFVVVDGVRYFCGAQSARARVCAMVGADAVRILRVPTGEESARHARAYVRGECIGMRALAEMLAEKPAAIPRALPFADPAEAHALADEVRAMRPAERADRILDWILARDKG